LGIVIAAVIAVELVVGAFIASNVGLYLALVVVAGAGALFVLRHPTAITYIALLWILFEKSAGAHDPNLTSMLSAVGDGLLVLGVLLGITVNIMRRRRPIFQIGPVFLGAVAFIAFGVASTIANGVPMTVATLGILDSIRSLLMFLIVINVGISVRDISRFLYFLIGLMAFSAFVGVLQISPHSPAWILGGLRFTGTHGLMRVDGIFDHPLSLGDYLALTTPLAIILLTLGNVRGTARNWLMFGVACMVAAIIFTFAREAWLAVPISIIVVGIFVEPRILKTAVPIIGLLAIAVVPFASKVNAADANGAQRLQLLKLTLPLIRNHWLLGAGPGRYGGHVADVTHTPLYNQYHVATFFYGTGNQIDQFWTHLIAESGILGVGAFLMMMIACFLVGRRAYLTSSDPRRRAILLGLLCAVPSAILLSFVSSVLEEGPASVLFWGLMGMLVVLAVRGDEPQELTEVTRVPEWTAG
jgi:hypothetical protein